MPLSASLRVLALAGGIVVAHPATAAAGTYPDPEAPSFDATAWRSLDVKTLDTEFAETHLTVPLQAVTSVHMRRATAGDPGEVVSLWIELTLPELRTVGWDTIERFRQPGAPDVLWMRLHADLPPGQMQRLEHQLQQAKARGLYREITRDHWHGLRLYALSNPNLPQVMEGFYEGAAGQRYVECRLETAQPSCSATFQRPEGITVEYSFGLSWLDRMEWLDGKVRALLASFVPDPQVGAAE